MSKRIDLRSEVIVVRKANVRHADHLPVAALGTSAGPAVPPVGERVLALHGEGLEGEGPVQPAELIANHHQPTDLLRAARHRSARACVVLVERVLRVELAQHRPVAALLGPAVRGDEALEGSHPGLVAGHPISPLAGKAAAPILQWKAPRRPCAAEDDAHAQPARRSRSLPAHHGRHARRLLARRLRPLPRAEVAGRPSGVARAERAARQGDAPGDGRAQHRRRRRPRDRRRSQLGRHAPTARDRGRRSSRRR